jgi:Bacterial SH3 domain
MLPVRSLLTALLAAPLLMAAACSAAPPDDEGASSADALSSGTSVTEGQKLTTTARVNIREGASTSDAIIDTLDSGVTVTALEDGPATNGFYHVDADGQEGWVYGAYLRASGGSTGSSSGGTSGTTPKGADEGPWSCGGRVNVKKPVGGQYSAITSFGCYVDSSGRAQGDVDDNCLPYCIDSARSSGLCKSSDTGKACEQRVGWFIANKDQWGCMARVRVTNTATGKSAIAVVLDQGPSCYIERSISSSVLDASGLLTRYLFGEDKSPKERGRVTVEAVAAGTKLGPE